MNHARNALALELEYTLTEGPLFDLNDLEDSRAFWSTVDQCEAALIRGLIKDLKYTSCVTLAGNGGAYELLEKWADQLEAKADEAADDC